MHTEARHQIVAAAQALIAGKTPFVDGVRRVLALRTAISALDRDPDFLVLVAVDSESDHLPGVETRSHCSPEWLKQCDSEAKALEAAYGTAVREACTKLIARFAREQDAASH